jgi:hypothetical protein
MLASTVYSWRVEKGTVFVGKKKSLVDGRVRRPRGTVPGCVLLADPRWTVEADRDEPPDHLVKDLALARDQVASGASRPTFALSLLRSPPDEPALSLASSITRISPSSGRPTPESRSSPSDPRRLSSRCGSLPTRPASSTARVLRAGSRACSKTSGNEEGTSLPVRRIMHLIFCGRQGRARPVVRLLRHKSTGLTPRPTRVRRWYRCR